LRPAGKCNGLSMADAERWHGPILGYDLTVGGVRCRAPSPM
jgi:hypothetical protein